jgi:hypothetical protein
MSRVISLGLTACVAALVAGYTASCIKVVAPPAPILLEHTHPLGELAEPPVLVAETDAAMQTCGTGATCSFECPAGSCNFACAPGSTCNVDCPGGSCNFTCEGGATCNFECPGGSCVTACSGGSTCNVDCDGGSCAATCAPGATCAGRCEGGDCS